MASCIDITAKKEKAVKALRHCQRRDKHTKAQAQAHGAGFLGEKQSKQDRNKKQEWLPCRSNILGSPTLLLPINLHYLTIR
jgi:hypothetical protein